MTTHTERVVAFGFLVLVAIIVFAPAKAPQEAAAAPRQRTERIVPAEGDYRDAAIDALHARILELEHEVTEWEEHHEAVHRGECVPRPDW